ncbi:MAG TPA: thiamine pyrophosphate-dependent enzyme, partial [Actinomycetota bacterium]|nr:thiamine pyrophosphate-dependent enzyme [Actinomycetota bacterium]
FAMVGDAGWLMSPGELVTAVAEGIRIIVVLVQNHGYASIGSLSEASGNGRFGTRFRYGADGTDGGVLPVDLAANAASLGARVLTPKTVGELADALKEAREADGPVVVHVETDPLEYVTIGGAWWDVAVAEVSTAESVQQARTDYERSKRDQRPYL